MSHQDAVQKPPPEPTTVRRGPGLYIVKGIPMIEKRSLLDANKQDTMTQQNANKKSPPKLTSTVTRENRDQNIVKGHLLVLKYRTDKQGVMAQQDAVQKPPPEGTTVRRDPDLYMVKGTPMIGKRSLLDAKKQKTMTQQNANKKPPPKLTSTVTRENRDQNIVKGHLLVLKYRTDKQDTMTQQNANKKPPPKLTSTVTRENSDQNIVKGHLLVLKYRTDKQGVMAQQDAVQKPPPEGTTVRRDPDLYMVKGTPMIEKRSLLDANKHDTMTQQNATKKPPPKLTSTVTRENRDQNIIKGHLLVLKYRTDNQGIMTHQDAVQKPPPQPMTVRRDPGLYMVKGIPMIEKRSLLDANKQNDTTSNSETKVNMNGPVKQGKPLFVTTSSGNLVVASSKTILCDRREAKMNMLQMRRDFSVHRFFLHLANVAIHLGNLSGLHDVAESIVKPDPQVAKFLAMRFRYFTTWVVMLHLFYSFSALTLQLYQQSERMRAGNSHMKVAIEKLKLFLEGLFRGILWPSSLVVTFFFWSLFNYDRELIFPKFVDEVVSSNANHILHTWITIFVFLEVLLNPRLRPLSVKPNLRVMFMFLVLYLSVFYYTRIKENIWLYPIFSGAYDSGFINFFLLHLFLLALFLLSYTALWTVNDRFHKHRQYLKKQTRFLVMRWGSEADKK